MSELIKNPIFWLIVAWVLRELWGNWKVKRRSLEDKINTMIKENTNEMSKLTLAVTKLEVKIEQLDRLTSKIPDLLDSLNVAHERIRNIAPQYDRPKTQA